MIRPVVAMVVCQLLWSPTLDWRGQTRRFTTPSAASATNG